MRASHRGFSLVELLIVIGIVLIAVTLVGLAVVAVRNVQAAAQRTQTISNLKQFGLAAHGFNDVYKRLPPGYGNGLVPITTKDAPRTLHVHLMPYIEADNIYKQILQSGADSNVVDIAKWTDGTLPFGAEYCVFNVPADRSTENRSGVQNLAANFRIFCNTERQKHVAAPDFVWPPLENPATVPAKNLPNPWEGAASIPKTFLIDGTSNCIMFTTRYARCGGKGPGTVDIEGGSLYAAHPGSTYGAFFGVEGANLPAARKATTEARPIFQLAPRSYECNPHASLFAQSFGTFGLQVVLADGSCRSIKPTISVRTWNLAIQPNDGKKMPQDWND